MAEEPETLTTTDARGGVTPHVVRYMLIISLLLAAAGIFWVLALAPKATQPDTSYSDTTAAPATAPQP